MARPIAPAAGNHRSDGSPGNTFHVTSTGRCRSWNGRARCAIVARGLDAHTLRPAFARFPPHPYRGRMGSSICGELAFCLNILNRG